MLMTEREIVQSYKNAICERAQVKILSELNLCEPDEIEKILKRNGIKKVKRGNRYGKCIKPDNERR